MSKEQASESAVEDAEEADQKEEDPVLLRDKKIAELTDDLKRLQAEFENYKKRVEREGGERVRSANQKFMSDLLPILDSFDKALENPKNPGIAEGLHSGLKGLHKQLLQILQREGLKEIPTDGRFDPFLHEAMLMEERDDREDGQILEVYQKGYVLQQKTIRPARVKVARKKAPEPPADDKAEVRGNQDHEDDQNQDQKQR